MPSTIITKNSSTASSVPSAGSLTQGELAVNVTDKRLYTKDSGGTVVELGTNPSALNISIAATTNSEARSVIKLADTSSVAQGNGGGLLFRGVYTGSTLVDAAGVQAYKANATDNDYSYGLAFVTRANGGNLTANMKLDQSGNLGLGVTPSAWGTSGTVLKALQLGTGANGGNFIAGANGFAGTFLGTNTYFNGTNWIYSSTAASAYYNVTAGSHVWYNAPSGTAGNAITFTQAMSLTAAGHLVAGKTATGEVLTAGFEYNNTNNTQYLSICNNGGSNAPFYIANKASGSTTLANFYSGSTLVGTITSNGTITVYGTTSDYRLKTVVGAVTGHGERLDALEPVEYTWNSNGSRTRGFLAHKFQEVYADSVSGTKDAVDSDGKAVYQQMQAGSPEVIADLVAEIKALRVRVAQLESN